jgi:hypothetical protein
MEIWDIREIECKVGLPQGVTAEKPLNSSRLASPRFDLRISTMTSDPCPPRDDLWRFLNEELNTARHVAVGTHVDTCQLCQAALDDLTRGRAYGLSLFSREPFDEPADDGSEHADPGSVPEHDHETEHAGEGPDPLAEAEPRALLSGSATGEDDPNDSPLDPDALIVDPAQTDPDSTPQPGRSAAELMATLARAVQVAHDAGIIHRDLKPSNVLFTDEGVPKVTDFGLAKRLESDSKQTETGQIMGSPCYMAPEQARGHTRDVGPAADVYALGSILDEMLTGRPPFKGETPIETVRQVVEDDVVPPSRLVPKVPRDLETMLGSIFSAGLPRVSARPLNGSRRWPIRTTPWPIWSSRWNRRSKASFSNWPSGGSSRA